MRNDDRHPVMREVFPMQSAFRANGYTTAAFGKRHLELACDEGWDIAASHFVSESPDDNYVHWIQQRGLGEVFDRDWAAEFCHGARGTPAERIEMPGAPMATLESQLPDDATMEAWTKQRTVGFIEQQGRSDRPFFCFASFYRPHQPYTPLERYYSRLDRSRWGTGRRAGDGISMPPGLRQDISQLPPRFQRVFEGVNRVFCLDRARKDEQLYRNYVAAYCALVEEIDTHVGDILDVLDTAGLRENTVVIYASDHGDFVGAHGMIEKCAAGHNIYEDILRVPLVISGPGLLRGSVSTGLTELLDLYPTLVDLCGLELPQLRHPLQGLSLANVLRHGKPTHRSFSISENWTQTAVIGERYKLGIWQEPLNPKASDYREFGDMMFDRETDPFDLNNLRFPTRDESVATQLRQYFERWQRETPRAPLDAAGEAVPTI
jgi:arylsulfatase A-like enzyme